MHQNYASILCTLCNDLSVVISYCWGWKFQMCIYVLTLSSLPCPKTKSLWQWTSQKWVPHFDLAAPNSHVCRHHFLDLGHVEESAPFWYHLVRKGEGWRGRPSQRVLAETEAAKAHKQMQWLCTNHGHQVRLPRSQKLNKKSLQG